VPGVPIRHVIAQTDLDPVSGAVIAPERARHAVIVAGRLHDLSGPVDPATHLNLDEPGHLLTWCVVAERLDRGAAVCRAGDGLRVAPVDPATYRRLGSVDHGGRRVAWLAAMHAQRAAGARAGHD
jgi:hypothetical protein